MRTLGIFCVVSIVWGANASPDQIRSAAAKGIALIQASQKDWYKKQSCTSCHHQLLPALAVASAREHGVPLDDAIANADAKTTFGLYADLDRAVQFTHVIDPAMDDAIGLIAANATGVGPNLVTAVYARLIAARQLPDGHWITGDDRPPQAYSNVTATAMSIRAIQLYSHPSLAADAKARIGKARAWLAAVRPRDTEERVDQMLGLSWAGADAALVQKLAQDLKSRQRQDGGWNSRDGLASDAYSTGQVLVALNDAASVAVTDPAWQRGIQFLLSTQASDGSWHVVSRLKPPAPVSPPYFETGYPYGHDQFISAMGAAWASMALARALGPAQKKAASVDIKVEAEPWAETLLFGSAADVRALLDRKFDPNSATKSGGTTALMLAMPDLEKAKLLLDRGAKINARSKTRYSALMVAAQYPQSAPTMKYLLAHGAQVRLPKGAGTPLFNAGPLMLAALAGNAEMIKPLRDAADDPNAKMMVLGLFPSDPLLQVLSFGDVAVVRELLELGVRADDADDDDITALSWAVIANRPEVAKLLIARGADVNHVDKKGMTPLLYAASIDFGDPATIDLLLKAGANPAARTKEGLTAAELARKYGNTQYLKPLRSGF